MSGSRTRDTSVVYFVRAQFREAPMVKIGTTVDLIARASLEAFVARLIAEGSIAISREDVA